MSVNKYNGTELIEIAGKGNIIEDTKDCKTTFTSSDDSTESGLILPSGGDITVPQIKNDTHGNLFSGLSKVALNTRKLVNTVKRLWNTVANEWVTGVNYSAEQVVTYIDGHTYICKTQHTSSASITPTNTTYWEDKTIGDMIATLNTNYANMGKTVKLGETTSNAGVSVPLSDNLSNYRYVLFVGEHSNDSNVLGMTTVDALKSGLLLAGSYTNVNGTNRINGFIRYESDTKVLIYCTTIGYTYVSASIYGVR